MNLDILPPKKPAEQPIPSQPQRVVPQPASEPVSVQRPQPIEPEQKPKKGMSLKKRVIVIVLAIVLLLVTAAVAIWIWYGQQLSAVSPGSDDKVKVVIVPGSDVSVIANVLKRNGLIKNEASFGWYVRLNGKAAALQSGAYRLGKGEDVPSIVKHLTSGSTDSFSITFLPGATLAKHRQVLIDTGYSEAQVDAALSKSYDHPLLKDKPAGADLEGYIYGETYSFAADATPEQILIRTFDQYESVIKKNNLVQLYQQRGFTLYQGITLASIIQREVATSSDAAQVAQVFELRLKSGMQLGSDVTYQYIADKTGQARAVDLDSPYNTRRYTGLPPGPISSPGLDSLIAVGSPADGDFVYFLSGDDDKTYFARTNEEHERNIQQHCQKKCQII